MHLLLLSSSDRPTSPYTATCSAQPTAVALLLLLLRGWLLLVTAG
jgi:hypothetical protein